METFISILLVAFLVYLLMGVIFSLFFYTKGKEKIDSTTSGSTLGFKLIIFPGLLMFWPFLFIKWRQANAKK